MASEEEAEKRPRMKKKKYVIEDVVMKTKNKIEPLLVNFANGQPLEGSELIGTMYRRANKQRMQTNKNILTINTPYLGYAGSQTDANKSSGVSTFLGILDPETGRMRLLETSQYTVQPVLNDAASHTSKPTVDANTYDEKQEAIAAAFGSKKAKQSVTRKRQNRVETETMSGAIDQAASAAPDVSFSVDEYLKQQEGTSLLTILPPCNRQATQIQDVYQLETLAPDDFLGQLQKSAEALLSGQDPGPKSTLLFRELVENARHEEKYANQLRLACVALLVKHLHVFLGLREQMLRDFMKGNLNADCCKGVVLWIMQEYTVQQGNFISRSKQDEHRALCLSLILAFISSRYELSVSTLLQSLPITRDQLDLLMRVIGASYSSPTHSYVLKLPLAKYSQFNKKSKRQKRK